MGPVLPPSPQLPLAVTNLSVLQRGDRLLISFSAPDRTTDNLPIQEFSTIDLRIGDDSQPFDFDAWSSHAVPYDVPTPERLDRDNPVAPVLHGDYSAGEWVGKRIAVLVRTAVRKNDHYSAWSNRVVLNVVPPLAAPSIHATPTSEGVLLTWPSPVADNVEYRVSRSDLLTKSLPVQIGTSRINQYVDTTAQFDTEYRYSVIAAQGSSESLPSNAADVKRVDIYPPSVPASLAALAGPNSVELSWARSSEADLKGYQLYRSVDGGPYTKLGTLMAIPAFTDGAVEHGKLYRYQITSVDTRNNESQPSEPVEVRF